MHLGGSSPVQTSRWFAWPAELMEGVMYRNEIETGG